MMFYVKGFLAVLVEVNSCVASPLSTESEALLLHVILWYSL